jgi:phosphate butyryltransferase
METGDPRAKTELDRDHITTWVAVKDKDKEGEAMKSPFFQHLEESLDRTRICRVAIPLAEDEACAFAVSQGVRSGLVQAKLIGDRTKIEAMYGEVARAPGVEIIAETDEKKACQTAVRLVRDGQADILMKGLVATSTLLKAVLHSQDGLKKNPLLSHLTFFELPDAPGMKILTDAALNIAPDADTLVKEIDNAIEAFGCFEKRPARVALLSANEKVSEKVPSTVLARETEKKCEGRADAIVAGPISLDLAISPESVQIKKYDGPVQGNADIFVVPRIEVGNVFDKSLQYYARAAMGGYVAGARCPVVLTSRADDNDTKFHSLLLGMVLWQRASCGGGQRALQKEAGK